MKPDHYPEEFDSIRPYSEEELSLALQRITQCPDFEIASRFVYPDSDPDDVRRQILSINSVDEFQKTIMYVAIKRIIDTTIDNLTWDGCDALDPNTPYLFVSNHRDIVLDAFLLQYVNYLNDIPTCQITFGANLMKHPLVVELGRLNKMFRVERGGSLRSFYSSMAQVSSYIRYCITQRRESVWIAQRNGRTKDGIDLTEPSLLKMFATSGNQDKDQITNLAELNIVPVAISYFWEPCDWMKAREMSITAGGGVYHKSEDEDLRSILTGIMQPKGNVHISVRKPITPEDLTQTLKHSSTQAFKSLAHLIDQRIHDGYRLTANNYIAHDIRSGTNKYADKYTAEQRETFLAHTLKHSNTQTLKHLIDIYANPIQGE